MHVDANCHWDSSTATRSSNRTLSSSLDECPGAAACDYAEGTCQTKCTGRDPTQCAASSSICSYDATAQECQPKCSGKTEQVCNATTECRVDSATGNCVEGCSAAYTKDLPACGNDTGCAVKDRKSTRLNSSH